MKLRRAVRQRSNDGRPHNEAPRPNSGVRLPLLFLLICAQLILSSCEPTYPARTLTSQLTKLVKEDYKIDVACHISGKTLWVYVPLSDLIDEAKLVWNLKGIEKMNEVISTVHRVMLSSDAKLKFLCVVATDIKKYGVELLAVEYVPDIQEAVLEKFSRGEFFARSVRDVGINPSAINDLTGKSENYYDITFDHFLGLQIIHRIKTLFYKDKTLQKIFEIKSATTTEKFGIIKLDFEFMRKTYNLTPREEKIDPLSYVSQMAALIVKNYNYRDFQAIELTDTFAKKTIKLTRDDLKKTKINLPTFNE